jgi:RES domain-containing protein
MKALPATVYRIGRREHTQTPAEALSGMGGLHGEGRWHSQGQLILYTSQSIALCKLERLAHADEWFGDENHDRVTLAIALPPSLSFVAVNAAALDQAEPTWREEGNRFCRNLGDAWLGRSKVCALVVPSAVVPDEWNILFNPAHRDFARVLTANAGLASRPLVIDPRVARLVRKTAAKR